MCSEFDFTFPYAPYAPVRPRTGAYGAYYPVSSILTVMGAYGGVRGRTGPTNYGKYWKSNFKASRFYKIFRSGHFLTGFPAFFPGKCPKTGQNGLGSKSFIKQNVLRIRFYISICPVRPRTPPYRGVRGLLSSIQYPYSDGGVRGSTGAYGAYKLWKILEIKF